MNELQKKYEKKHKVAKILKKIAPIIFIVSLVIGSLFLISTIKHSLGNFGEMVDMLDKKAHTGEELQENYAYLIEKYGEWVIGNGSNGFQISFINIKNVLFGKFAIISFMSSIFFFVFAFVIKWLLPTIAKEIDDENDSMVNLANLETNQKINELYEKRKK